MPSFTIMQFQNSKRKSSWIRDVQTSISLLFVLTMIAGIAYPVTVTVFAQLMFPHQANGSLIYAEGQLIGSELLGQDFAKPEYFWGRLSATTPCPNNSSASGGSNFGQQHPDLIAHAEKRIDELKHYDGTSTHFPVDLVTSSGSGLDPHICVEAARIQIHRVASQRGMHIDEVGALVQKYTSYAQFGFLGQPSVHVLKLNLELDRMKPMD